MEPPPLLPLNVIALFVVIVFGLVVLLIVAVWRAGRNLGEMREVTWRWTMRITVLVFIWLTVTVTLAERGSLSDWSKFPPPIIQLLAAAIIVTGVCAFSRLGSRLIAGLPISALIGFQVFRIPVELILFLFYQNGAMPVQMTFEGRNFDVLTGLSAPVIAWLAARKRLPMWSLLAWNLMGLGLLVNVVTIAMLSAPTPFRVFLNEPATTLITSAPYVWLPAFIVQAALFGHLLVFRWLWRAA